MPSIILASASAQRKKLLQLAGVKFRVCPSKAEEITKITTTCSALVRKNALLKAHDVAELLREGVVIGADTIVYAKKSGIIGKPKNLKDAKRILRVLFSRPHWVYTGVAVIDAKTGRSRVDCEKTKVFMHKLSNEEIDRYHRITSPLDKAGGFDIEGRGGLFINRIEGCYSNVIGLPLAKLRRMLRQFGVSLLSVLLTLTLAGCASEFNLATKQQETLIYGTEKEVQIGDAASRQLEENYKLVTDVDVNERVRGILDRLVPVCDRKDLVYTIRVIEGEDINAVSLPGGYIYLFQGLVEKLDDDELAGVIAHELGHITARHGIKRLQASYGYLLVQALAVASRDAQMAQGASTLYAVAFLAYSRQDEFEADRLSVKYVKKAGLNAKGMVGALEEIQKEQERKVRPVTYFKTHPYLTERIAVVNKEVAGQMSFRDYLNLTGSDEGIKGAQGY